LLQVGDRLTDCGLSQPHATSRLADAAAFGDLNEYVERPEVEIETIKSSTIWGQAAPVAVRHVMNSLRSKR
jgi:hypothetical protein